MLKLGKYIGNEGFLEGEPMEISFNSRYLLDALKSVDSEEIYGTTCS